MKIHKAIVACPFILYFRKSMEAKGILKTRSRMISRFILEE